MEPKVELLAWTPNADQIAMEAAAICYDSEPSADVVRYCLKSGHHSILEHNAFTFRIMVARVISQQFTRHRLASFSQRSQRYVVEDRFAYYTPPEIKETPALEDKWYDFQQRVQEMYNYLLEAGLKPEAARMALSNATQTEFIMTMNARELRHFFRLRLCNRAQREIRTLAWEMVTRLKEVAPILFGDISYPCDMFAQCDQGKMSCGRIEEVKQSALEAAAASPEE